jgi:CubicO group peptidase (beta-lactamase class C family)
VSIAAPEAVHTGEVDRRSFAAATACGVFAAACARNGPRRPGTTSEGLAVPTKTSTAASVTAVAVSATSPPDTAPTPSGELLSWVAADFALIDSFVSSTGGSALRIVESGKVVHEWYRNGETTFSRDIASAQKSVLSILVGIAADRGLIALDTTVDSVLGTSWATGNSSSINIGHLLTMTSGLSNSLKVVDRPGAAWRYNNAFGQLFNVLESITGTEINEVATDWLFDPIGASGAEFRIRTNVDVGVGAGYGLVCTARQLATIGSMVLGNGLQPVSRAWLDASFVSSQSFNLAYGRLWWLNGQASYLVPEGQFFDGALVPSAPSDMVAALGKDDQKLYICPSLELVVVRLGAKADPTSKLALSSFDNDLWTRLIAERVRTG